MTTNFERIKFDPDSHTYTLDGRELTSVSRTVARLKPPFDAEGVAAAVANRDGRPVAEVLAGWNDKREAALARGARLHAYIEAALTGRANGDHRPRLPEMDAWDLFWSRLEAMDQPAVERVEWMVGDEALGVAGTLDALLVSGNSGLAHIWDWKTGGKFNTVNRWEQLLAPFNDLDNCELSVYSLQVSLYRLIVERNTGLALGDSYIVHLPPEGPAYVHPAIDLRERLVAWLGVSIAQRGRAWRGWAWLGEDKY